MDSTKRIRHPISELQTPEGKAWADKFLALGVLESELYFYNESDGTESVTMNKKNLFAFARRILPPEAVMDVLQRKCGIALTLEEEVELFCGGENQ